MNKPKDYIQQAKDIIRNEWFKDHVIRNIEGEEGLQRITFGRPDSSTYLMQIVLSNNIVCITGDIGSAMYRLTECATLSDLSRYNLSYFTGKLISSERDKYEFDSKLAARQIESYFLDWCEVDDIDELNVSDKELFNDLINETFNWSTPQHFNTGVYNVYANSTSDWFDGETASCVSECGLELSYSIIAYWVALQMIAELVVSAEQV